MGGGDPFLAGFLSKRLRKETSAREIIAQAVSLGAFIISQEKTCPDYVLEYFRKFKNSHPLSALS